MTTKEKAKRSARGKMRQDAPRDLWTASAPSLEFGRENFRFVLERSERRLPSLDLTPRVLTADWDRANGGRTGTLNFERGLTGAEAALVANGDVVRCDVRVSESASFLTLWRMSVSNPQDQIQQGQTTLTLASVLAPASKSRVTMKFGTTHDHPHGWNAQEVTVHVCRRFRIPMGRIAAATYRFPKLISRSASPLDAIVSAWQRERSHTGRRFDVDFSTGVLEVRELREPRYMLLIGPSLLDATLSRTLASMASAVVASAPRKQKGKRKQAKLRVRVVDERRARRYGYVVKTLTAPHPMASVAELKRWALAQLAASFKPKSTVTFTHPGIPYLDVGDALRLQIPETDFQQIVFVTDAHHNLSPGSYTVEVTVAFDDPWRVDERKARATLKREAAARQRRRTAAERRRSHPRPKKAAVRS